MHIKRQKNQLNAAWNVHHVVGHNKDMAYCLVYGNEERARVNSSKRVTVLLMEPRSAWISLYFSWVWRHDCQKREVQLKNVVVGKVSIKMQWRPST